MLGIPLGPHRLHRDLRGDDRGLYRERSEENPPLARRSFPRDPGSRALEMANETPGTYHVPMTTPQQQAPAPAPAASAKPRMKRWKKILLVSGGVVLGLILVVLAIGPAI